MTISRALRYQILRRDNHACRYCGATALDGRLTVDHVLPTALGGSDDPTNLVTACSACNAGKAATPPDAPLLVDVAEDARRWALAMRSVASTAIADRERRLERRATVDALWHEFAEKARIGHYASSYRPEDWEVSVDRLASAGAQLIDFTDAIEITMSKTQVSARDLWRYMCGIIWRRLEERAQAARDLLTTEEP